jgi:hypothetical protein
MEKAFKINKKNMDHYAFTLGLAQDFNTPNVNQKANRK